MKSDPNKSIYECSKRHTDSCEKRIDACIAEFGRLSAASTHVALERAESFKKTSEEIGNRWSSWTNSPSINPVAEIFTGLANDTINSAGRYSIRCSGATMILERCTAVTVAVQAAR